MCGIAGYIGQSKKPKLTYELITCLFDYLELRGTDASGVWGTEFGERNRIIYHKEPVRSSRFINKSFWQSLRKVRTDMLLVHARATSSKGGNAFCNTNNHPFVSLDRRIGMVHNGNIDEADYLKTKYQTLSETDSECLLRIYEHGMDEENDPIENVPEEVSRRLNGIKDIWSYIHSGAMAVALGERYDDLKRGLFLFRNEKRPLWVADLRDLLGQVFFFSTPEIWYNAVFKNQNLKNQCWDSQKLIEIPENEVWYLGIDEENRVVNEKNFFRFSLETRHTGEEFQQGEFKSIKPSQIELEVITKMDDSDELVKSKNQQCSIVNEEIYEDDLWRNVEVNQDFVDPNSSDTNYGNSTNWSEHDELCKNIAQLSQSINTTTDNLCSENSISTHDYTVLLESLEQIKRDLEGTIQILQG